MSLIKQSSLLLFLLLLLLLHTHFPSLLCEVLVPVPDQCCDGTRNSSGGILSTEFSVGGQIWAKVDMI